MPRPGNGQQNILCRKSVKMKCNDREKLYLHIEWQILIFFSTFPMLIFFDNLIEIEKNCEKFTKWIRYQE